MPLITKWCTIPSALRRLTKQKTPKRKILTDIEIVVFETRRLRLMLELEITTQTREELLEKLCHRMLCEFIKPIDSTGLLRLQNLFCVELLWAKPLLTSHLG